MNNKDYDFRNETGTWQTGRTEPPKRHSALISVLLVLVILLCGISTALGFLNFKLYKELTQPEEPSRVSFSRGVDTVETVVIHEEDLSLPGLGLQGTMIPAVYQRYYKLPNGIYVTKVDSASEAFSKSIVAGDIITEMANTAVTDKAALEQLMQTFTPGQEVTLQLYRNGTVSALTLIWNA